MIAVPATKTYSLSRLYGGVAFHNSYPYLVLRYRDGSATKRPVYRFDEAGSWEGAPALYLQDTDGVAYETEFATLSYVNGEWRGCFTIIPPAMIDSGGYRYITLARVGVWNADGTPAVTTWGIGFSAIRLSDGVEMSPYDSIIPSLADRLYSGDHDSFFCDARNRLIAWRAGMLWSLTPSRTDPVYVGQYRNLTSQFRPLDFDGPNRNEYLITVEPGGIIRWWDVTAWDTVSQTVSLVPYKSFLAKDAASGIQDLCIDTTNDVLWVLTTSQELQRYDLTYYSSAEIPQDVPARAVRPLLPPTSVTQGSSASLSWQLLDMWGVATKRVHTVKVIAAATNEAGDFYGAVGGERYLETESLPSGLVTVSYQSLSGITIDSGPESVYAIVEEQTI